MALWTLFGDGSAPKADQVVAPNQRLSWPRTIALGGQHVVAMFGATFVFPIVMGLDPNLAVMMSGIATLLFLFIVKGRVPSYLGTSASFVGAVAAIRADGGGSPDVTGAFIAAGVALVLCGFAIHFAGPAFIHAVFPPAVTGAIVMLVGLNLAPVAAKIYFPQDQWIAIITMLAVILMSVLLPGIWGRISILLGLIFGFVLSGLADQVLGKHDVVSNGETTKAFRVNLDSVHEVAWLGLPNTHAPEFHTSYILLVLPAVIALVAENTGHVKAVAQMTGENLDRSLGRAIIGDGVGTMLAGSVGGSPTTTYAENIGVMAATRVYSTAAYLVAAIVAIGFGLCPKFGALVAATPGGVLGGITVVLYGMIALLGAKIWVEDRTDFSNPATLVPLAAGIIIATGDVTLQITDEFSVGGIALGAFTCIAGFHVLRAITRHRERNTGATFEDPQVTAPIS